MTEPGPWRIIATPSGDWCDECYGDIKDDTDQDHMTMGTIRVSHDGTCVCCGGTVVAGEMLDTPDPGPVVFHLSAIPKEAVHP